MAYLEDKGIVHRDLAARNVLVANAKTVKISDLGLARKIADYYKSTRQGKWPLKWYAPECIEFSKFSSQSDVWGFGVTAWECMTFGKKPFKGWTGQMVVQNVIMERRRLPHPPKCPQPLFDLLGRCWEHEPHDRPRFKDMIGQISAMRSQLAGGHQYNSSAQAANADQEIYDIIPDPNELRYEEKGVTNGAIKGKSPDSRKPGTGKGKGKGKGAPASYQNVAYDDRGTPMRRVKPAPEPDVYEAMGPSLKLSRQSIQVGTTELGRGNYGVVLKGALTVALNGAPSPAATFQSQGPGKPLPVAIKTLPDDKADVQPARDDLWEEIKIMCKVQSEGGHANVVRFNGYAGRPEASARGGGAMLLVLEFAGNGSLRRHLEKQREGRDAQFCLPAQQLHDFAAEIAGGMCFISKIGVVHRDLATRNVLLDDEMRCKIADFGLSKILGTEVQYTADTANTESNPIAWAWTSLEGLADGVFTAKGDVWSYGIVLAELCSLGRRPYLAFNAPSPDFLEYLQDGKRIELSGRWPEYLCGLMKQCWDGNPGKRPSFPTIVRNLASNCLADEPDADLRGLVDSLDRVPLLRAKLLFVGRGRSGKTSTFKVRPSLCSRSQPNDLELWPTAVSKRWHAVSGTVRVLRAALTQCAHAWCVFPARL